MAVTKRTFMYDGRAFPDPDPNLSADDVRKQLAEFFPELTNADTREEKREDGTVYVFSKRIGTKGATAPASPSPETVVAILRAVPEKRLRVFELARDLLDGDGELDLDAAADRAPDVNLALAEAKSYARATERAVEAIRRLPAR